MSRRAGARGVVPSADVVPRDPRQGTSSTSDSHRTPHSFAEHLLRDGVYLLMLVAIGVVHAVSFLGRTAASGAAPTTPPTSPVPDWMTQSLAWERLLQTRMDLAVTLIVVTLGGLVVLLVGTLRLAGLIDRLRRRAARLWPGHLRFHAPWSIGDVVRLAVVITFVAHLVAVGQTLLEMWRPDRRLDEHARMLINTAMVDALVLVGGWALLRQHGLSWRGLGLSLEGMGGALRHAVAWYVTAVPVLAGVLLATMLVVRISGWEPSPQPVFELLYAEEQPVMVQYAMWMVVLLGPVAEEVFFRGLAYTALKRRIGIGWAITISAFVFSLLHFDPVGFVPIMVLGMLLAYLYEQTGSLVVPIVVHAAHNSLMVGMVALVRAAVQAAA